ncbi:MAG: hypothetical protein CMJ75_19855 [Planctomycetaceae bacterium]|nr:hypothetical protein [Planctomycetaceae bacterium]
MEFRGGHVAFRSMFGTIGRHLHHDNRTNQSNITGSLLPLTQIQFRRKRQFGSSVAGCAAKRRA